MASAALQEGEIFAGRYRIVRELASGGMGAVFEVVHNVTERRCALKVMLAHTVEREQLRKRFMLESRLAAQIGSEYIVDVLDAGVDEDTKAPYLVMELLEGEDLGQRLLRTGGLPPAEAAAHLWHVALALDRTHDAGIVHRDLKASNLFLTHREDGTPLVKVLDFGVAKVLTLEHSGAEQRTQTVGTPIYMAPEQFRAEGRISASTDIYALGMLAYTLLVGVHYWREEHEQCENPFAFASVAVHGPKQAPSLRASREGIALPEAFDTWFAKATARWPQDRFETATQAVAALATALGTSAALVPAPASLPNTSLDAEEEGITRVTSASSMGLPATLEALSGRLAALPPRTVTPPSAVPLLPSRAAGARSPSHASQGEQHTEVSLTVTSGASHPFQLDEQKPHGARSLTLAAVAVALVTAAAVVALVAPWQAETTIEPQKTQAGRPPAEPVSAAKPSSQAKPAPTTPRSLDSLEIDRGATRIDDLPIAPSHLSRLPRAPGEVPAGRASQPASGRSRAASRPEEPGMTSPAPTPQGNRGAPAQDPAATREHLYGRD